MADYRPDPPHWGSDLKGQAQHVSCACTGFGGGGGGGGDFLADWEESETRSFFSVRSSRIPVIARYAACIKHNIVWCCTQLQDRFYHHPNEDRQTRELCLASLIREIVLHNRTQS